MKKRSAPIAHAEEEVVVAFGGSRVSPVKKVRKKNLFGWRVPLGS